MAEELSDLIPTEADETDEEKIPPIQRYFNVKLLGYCSGIVAAVCYTAGTASVQALGDFVPMFELNVLRFATQTVFGLLLSRLLKINVFDLKLVTRWLVLFSVLNTMSNACIYRAVEYISLTEVVVLELGGPALLTWILITLWHRTCKKLEAAASIISLIGICLVFQPDFIFGLFTTVHRPNTHPLCGTEQSEISQNDSQGNARGMLLNMTKQYGEWTTQNQITGSSADTSTGTEMTPSNFTESDAYTFVIEHTSLGYILALSGSVIITVLYMISNIYLQEVHVVVLTFWSGITAFLVSALLMFIVNEPLTFPSSAVCISLLFGHSLGISLGNLFWYYAIVNISPNMLAVLLLLEIVLVVCLQYTLMKAINPGLQNMTEILGALVVFLCNVVGPFYNIYLEIKSKE